MLMLLAKAIELKETSTISLYFLNSPEMCNFNDNVIPVARIAGKAWNVPKSGTVIIIEDPISPLPQVKTQLNLAVPKACT